MSVLTRSVTRPLAALRPTLDIVDWSDYDAALFDLDGVVTPTAEVHMRAWRQMFSGFLEAEGIAEPYDDAEYFASIDGKPRFDGVRAFLASRGLELPEGTPEDDSDQRTVGGLGNRKNAVFAKILQTEGVEPYPGSVALLDALASQPIRLAIVSSSRNAPAVLEAAGLADRFETIVDGTVAESAGLPGKPAPDTFLHAARLLGTGPERSVVIEDAVSGVQAGRAGDFGRVIGVDRGAGVETLSRAGADVVVPDLADLVPA